MLPKHKLHQCSATSSTESRPNSTMKVPDFVKVKDRIGAQYQVAYDTGAYKPIAFASTLHNEKVAVNNRVLKPTPEPVPAVSSDYVRFVKKNLNALLPHWHKVKPVPFEEYLKHSNASPAVKDLLRKTRLQLDQQGIGRDMVSDDLAYKWTMRKSFVKVENLCYNSPNIENVAILNELEGLAMFNDRNKPKAPRLIQGASPEFIAIMGPFFMAVQRMIKQIWNKNSPIYFTSGASSKEVADHVLNGHDQILEDDVGAFDTSVHSEICELELWTTQKFGCTPLQYQLFKANIKTHGFTQHGIFYKVLGTRKSGDPFTSVYNSLLNGFMHIWAYCTLADKKVEEAMATIRMVLQGDDNVMRHPGPQLDFKFLLRCLGFDCEANYRDSVYDVEFCSNIVYKTTEGLTFGPKIGKVLCKFGYFVNPPQNVDPYSLLRGVALGLRAACSYIPILRAVVERVIKATSNYQAIFLKTWHGLRYQHMQNGDPGYAVHNRYKLDANTVAEMEKTIQQGDIHMKLCGMFTVLFDRDTDATPCIFINQ